MKLVPRTFPADAAYGDEIELLLDGSDGAIMGLLHRTTTGWTVKVHGKFLDQTFDQVDNAILAAETAADPYPEHTKLKSLEGANNTVGEFLDWIQGQGLVICDWDKDWEGDATFEPIHTSKPDLIARFFNINQTELEREKRAMLEILRGEANG